MVGNVTLPEYEYEIDLSHDDVQSETDVAQLKADYLQLDQEGLEMVSFIEAYRLAEIDDEPWFRRIGGKLAYNKIAQRWIERRILELGETPPYQMSDPRARALRVLNEKVEKMAARIKELEKEG